MNQSLPRAHVDQLWLQLCVGETSYAEQGAGTVGMVMAMLSGILGWRWVFWAAILSGVLGWRWVFSDGGGYFGLAMGILGWRCCRVFWDGDGYFGLASCRVFKNGDGLLDGLGWRYCWSAMMTRYTCVFSSTHDREVMQSLGIFI